MPKGRGGPRANSGGKRDGAGRKPTISVVRTVSARLDQHTSDLLASVEADGKTQSEALRWCIEHAVEHCEREAAELCAESKS